ncbi:MAG: c-type cytochrome [Pirellulales bacterium]|nr:c-type cytochrome [Pirellulales bacterium]
MKIPDHLLRTLVALVLLSAYQHASAQSLTSKLREEGAARLAKAATEEGSAARGAILFPQQKLQCVRCHVAGHTDVLGPDLTRLGTDVSSESLVESLLNPSKVIAKGFETSVITTIDGVLIVGQIISQDDKRILVRVASEPTKTQTIPAADIDETVLSKTSSMPDNLPDQLNSRQEFLDLVRYLMEIADSGTPTASEGQPSGGGAISLQHQGLLLLDRFNCGACHEGKWQYPNRAPHRGPNLKWCAENVDPSFIGRYIASPAHEKPAARMPHLLGRFDAATRAEAARAITHYVVAFGDTPFARQARDRVAARRGQELFHSVGCVACHSPRDEAGQEILPESSEPLGNLDGKYSVAGLTKFLYDPHASRPEGRMPSMRLTYWESRDIANYLLQENQLTGRLRYTLYEGKMHEGFDRLAGKATAAGIAGAFSLAPFEAYRHDFAVVFDGYLELPEAGSYVFALNCNDAGRLVIDGKTLIDLPAQPGDQAQSAEVRTELASGMHAIQLSYLQLQKKSQLDLRFQGPGRVRGPVPESMLSSHAQSIIATPPFRVDSDLAQKGEALFRQIGCAACHQVDGAAVVSERPAIPIEDAAGGCLSEESGDWPQFAMKPAERELLRLGLGADAGALTGEEQIATTMTRLACFACHQRDGLGGVALQRDQYFRSADANLGPQGRSPPHLTGVGAKLKPAWLRDVLVNGRSIRPYMHTRMPQYGSENVAHLIDLFARIDDLPEVEYEGIADLAKAGEISTELVGSDGLNCVACHTFQKRAAQTMSAVDLTEMGERLNKEWFFHYMLDPQRLGPRTVMPSFWPGGRAIRQDILKGSVAGQIEHIWHYLQDGRQARYPHGLRFDPFELIATDEAILLRRSFEETGKRGIGVGYPAQVNLAFDAEQMRLAMIWKGKFADPAHVWFGQGSGHARPAGDPPLHFSKGPDLDDAANPWVVDEGRPPKHQFTGYYLDALRRPTFTYRFEDVDVEDYTIDVRRKDAVVLRRVLTFRAVKERDNLLFRVASGETIQRSEDAEYQVGEDLRIRLIGGVNAKIETTLTDQRLMVPVVATKDKSTLVIEYIW